MDVSMWTTRLTPDDPASEWAPCPEAGADEMASGLLLAMPDTLPLSSRLPLQLQSETQRKLELRDKDMGDVWVPALSNVGGDSGLLLFECSASATW